MQTKSSYRALKWTVFMGMAAALASACVVSSGDGDDDPFGADGGEGGTDNSTSGTKNTAGTKAGSSGSAGKGGTGGTAGSGTAGSTADGGMGGEAYVPGACETDLSTPSMLPSCDAKADDNDCGKCLKVKCCDSLQACYGTEPTSACGYGAKSDDDLGQFDCIRDCYDKGNDGTKSQADLVADCAGECANQCADVGDGLINSDTQALLDCAQNGADGDMGMGTDDCNDACFPPPM
jgi:hypothetical protein